MLSFTIDNGTKILVTKSRKENGFLFYEEEVKPKNICIYLAMFTTKRIENYKQKNTEAFKEIFNNNIAYGWDANHEFILI